MKMNLAVKDRRKNLDTEFVFLDYQRPLPDRSSRHDWISSAAQLSTLGRSWLQGGAFGAEKLAADGELHHTKGTDFAVAGSAAVGHQKGRLVMAGNADRNSPAQLGCRELRIPRLYPNSTHHM
jgi:hypothetical protein